MFGGMITILAFAGPFTPRSTTAQDWPAAGIFWGREVGDTWLDGTSMFFVRMRETIAPKPGSIVRS